MNERRENSVKNTEGVIVTPVSLSNVPSDSDPSLTFEINQVRNGDLGFWIYDSLARNFTTPVRINSGSGGGPYKFIHSDFVELIRNFDKYNGQIPSELPKPEVSDLEMLPLGNVPTRAIEGENDDLFSLKITDIESMDNMDSGPLNGYSFLDIEVLKTGDAILKIKTDFEDGNLITQEILFNSDENGGRFPIFAEYLKVIALKIQKAQENYLTQYK